MNNKEDSYLLSEQIPDAVLDPNREYELVHSGMNASEIYGDFRYSEAELEQMKDNFNSNIRALDIPVDVNHHKNHKAYAWVKPGSMVVKESSRIPGQKSLYAQLHRFTPKGAELVKTGAYRYFSVQVKHAYDYFAEGMKKAAKNVIVAVALTNSPVVKGLAPTYAEQPTSTNNPNMEMFKAYLETLQSKKVLSGEEKQTLKKMHAALPEADQAVMQKSVDTFMALPETEVTPPAEKAPEAPTAKVDPEAKPEVPAEKAPEAAPADKPEDKKLSEVTERELSEVRAESRRLVEENDKLKQQINERQLSETVGEFLLSEKNTVGFIADKKDELTEFVRSLSEPQVTQFRKLVGEVKTVDLSERGHSAPVTSSTIDDANRLALDIMKDEGVSKSTALTKAFKKLKLVK